MSRYFPLVMTVGSALVFPYYIIWLKNSSLTFPMFAWFFAIHSFAAALGYVVCHKWSTPSIYWLYGVMGLVFVGVGFSENNMSVFLYLVLMTQLILGFLQGYFRAWHITQPLYSIHAVSNYLLVGFAMLGVSFIRFVSPQQIILLFGIVLIVCFFSGAVCEKKPKSEEKAI
ncbi:hypothetical protein [Kurthia sibirica]|uniref:Uncharacterized protein n=1 Tax=Kurthia sibirica TaxID=202750 RepID=A0A2U3AP41_9BACL|nr:hypothetical protein [Kurthia sibirica]PWI26304.1 hypothetical protein DEX24_02925 [Kurthia sibirica]GEK35027.1 hypothetical protein KSI01_25600 [Kurthia sibirica]